MKIKVKKKDIIDVLAKIQGITGRKSNLAITENVLIQSSGSEIKVQATDLETGFEGFYPAKVEKNGVVALNSRKLFLTAIPKYSLQRKKGFPMWITVNQISILI